MNRPHRVLSIVAVVMTVSVAGRAGAAPLSLFEIDRLSNFLSCGEGCELQSPAWDKNADGAFTQSDLSLAFLEYWDAGAEEYLCYQDGAVFTSAQCALLASTCAEEHSLGECVDGDGDGLVKWVEDTLGTSDQEVNASCEERSDCCPGGECDFFMSCREASKLRPELSGLTSKLCYEATCGAGCASCDLACDPRTVFHLEKVAANRQELILHVYFDYAPEPVRLLDLMLEYNDDDLTLVDARPLSALTSSQKELAVTHPVSNGTTDFIRLVMLSPGNVLPISRGALVELVFARTSDSATTVGFVSDNTTQRRSMAPDQDPDGVKRNSALERDSLWGAPVTVGGGSEGDRLVLYYDFDNLSSPLAYGDIPTAAGLCESMPACANESNPNTRAAFVERLEALQRGAVNVDESIVGVSAGAAYFDGAYDHLALPLFLEDYTTSPYEKYVASDQSSSVSFWFYSEGNSRDESAQSVQVLYSRNTKSERTRYGLMLEPKGDDTASLVYFDGDYRDPAVTRQTVVESLPLRTWTNVGLSFDAQTGGIRVYIGGALVLETVTDPNTASACPQFDGAPGFGLTLPLEGDAVDAARPETLYYASRENGLWGIDTMDPSGMSRQVILRDGEFVYMNPAYHPGLDKLLYVSNAGGSYEVWIADGDGDLNSRHQVTVGFGDLSRGVFARRPTWAPDGSGIVFESNVFDLNLDHNAFKRTYQLYYIPYESVTNEVAVPTGGGMTATVLNYQDLLGAALLDQHQLTTAPRNHQNAVWLEGRGESTLGKLLLNSSTDLFEDRSIERLEIRTPRNTSIMEPLMGLDQGVNAEPFLLAGAKIGGEDKLLYRSEWYSYLASEDYALSVSPAAPEVGDVVTVTLSHTPSDSYDETCWDRNHNSMEDFGEDRNGDGLYTRLDCYPIDVRNLYLNYNGVVLGARDDDALKGASLSPVLAGGVEKDISVYSYNHGADYYTRFEVLSPINNLPLPAGAELVQLKFEMKEAGPLNLELRTRETHTQLYLRNLLGGGGSVPVAVEYLFEVTSAAFAPDGTGLILGGTANARPTLVLTDRCLASEVALGTCAGIVTTGGGEVATLTSGDLSVSLNSAIEGLSWTSTDRFVSCAWVGAHQDRGSRVMKSAFRGGLDEFKVFNYVREEGAFLSDAARGNERLQVEGRDGPTETRLPVCGGSDAECPSYHLCINNTCEMVGCDPGDPYSCPRGQCALRPNTVEREEVVPGEDLDWVCSSECNYHSECYTQECTNGPCLFCDEATNSCGECRERTDHYGEGFSLTYIEGCPDRNSFACEEGACVTECYSFDNGQSLYLCDPGLEYCYQGRCVLHDWKWEDLSPASFSGAGEARHTNVIYTEGKAQLYPIVVQAYGVEDYGRSPVLLVEGQALPGNGITGGESAIYGGRWFTLGRIAVNNRTRQQAQDGQKAYHLLTPHRLTNLRMRVINAPYINQNGTATGMLEKDGRFCESEARRAGFNNGEASSLCTVGLATEDLRESCVAQASAARVNPIICYGPLNRWANGSRFNLGYRVGIPDFEVFHACAERGGQNCQEIPQTDTARGYLYGGASAVIVVDAMVNGTSVKNNITTNTVCSYQGAATPTDPGTGAVRKVFYGDVARENSNERSFYCATPGADCVGGVELLDRAVEARNSFALLNCNFASAESGVARVEFQGLESVFGDSILDAGRTITENSNSCRVSLGNDRTELCYEIVGGEANLDFANNAVTPYNLLDFEEFTGWASREPDSGYYYGCEEGFAVDVCGQCVAPGQAAGKRDYYEDEDGDGLGNPSVVRSACTLPLGFVDNADDLYPGCPSNNPLSCDVCGEAARDCAGVCYGTSLRDHCGVCGGDNTGCQGCAGVMDSCGVCDGTGPLTWFADTDGDGLGDPAVSLDSCSQPTGYVDNANDSEPALSCEGTIDTCGVCDGNNASMDACEVCGGTNDCVDCAGVPNGPGQVYPTDNSCCPNGLATGLNVYWWDIEGDGLGVSASSVAHGHADIITCNAGVPPGYASSRGGVDFCPTVARVVGVPRTNMDLDANGVCDSIQCLGGSTSFPCQDTTPRDD